MRIAAAADAAPVRARRCPAWAVRSALAVAPVAEPPVAAAGREQAGAAAAAAVAAAPPGSEPPAAAGVQEQNQALPDVAAVGRDHCRPAADWARSPPIPPVHARRAPLRRRFKACMLADFLCAAHFFRRNAPGVRMKANMAKGWTSAAVALNSGDRRHEARRKISDALVPPKPNEFDSATLISRLRALCGTRSIGVSTDGLSRLSVGGTIPSRIASTE
jgi:hypothetical protein